MKHVKERDRGTDFDALVLAGGSGSRLGGADKATLEIGGRTLLENAIDAVSAARRIVVAGDRHEIEGEVVWVRERPPGGGPMAAIAAGLGFVTAELVVVLAVDLPNATAERVRTVVTLGEGRDGAIYVDDSDRDQPLFGCYRTARLRRAVADLPRVVGASVKEVTALLDLERIRDHDACADCDTWGGLAALRAAAVARG